MGKDDRNMFIKIIDLIKNKVVSLMLILGMNEYKPVIDSKKVWKLYIKGFGPFYNYKSIYGNKLKSIPSYPYWIPLFLPYA